MATEPALVALQATAELYDEEGFQRTGDVCEQQGPDTFMWIDRVSNIIKLSQGEYVSVSRLEALYAANSPSVHQMYLYGNSLRAYLVAIVVAQQGETHAFDVHSLRVCVLALIMQSTAPSDLCAPVLLLGISLGLGSCWR